LEEIRDTSATQDVVRNRNQKHKLRATMKKRISWEMAKNRVGGRPWQEPENRGVATALIRYFKWIGAYTNIFLTGKAPNDFEVFKIRFQLTCFSSKAVVL
jgi:hypothetical protein